MAKNLVIVESPAKAKTINKILGADFVVKSSMGHVRDLPVKALNVDIKNGFKPKYAITPGKKKVVDELKSAAKSCETVYLSTDPDREGEAIAWHLKTLLDSGDNSKNFLRVQYNEITPGAIRKAFSAPGDLDMNRVDAQQARRILDRIVGYTVSPMLWRRMKRGLSAGRVQSVALRLVCEREDEITKFVPEEYWILGARVRKLVEPQDPFRIKLMRINNEKADVKSAAQSEAVKSDLEGRPLKVVEIATKEVHKRSFPPYITSTLQQAGSSYCGFSPNRTMRIAQTLYEGVDLGDGPVGLITYMRTDSFNISQDALGAVRGYIKEQYGAEYCPENPNFYKSRGGAQEAHEAIRPTDVSRTPESLQGRLEPSDLKLYAMIWRRFVASQMTPARLNQRTVKIEAQPVENKPNSYLFSATVSEVAFPGYMKVTGMDQPKEKEGETEEDLENQRIPPLTEGELVECLEWLAERKETQPPPRYSEASLIKALEANGVGRPSTYAQIVSTLYQREYVKQEKKSVMPTDLGKQVCTLLISTLNQLFDVKFTASMEDKLDEIEKGTVKWTDMLETFYKQFDEWMVLTKLPAADNGKVKQVMDELAKVQSWAPEVTHGKRTFSDQKFVESIKKQMDSAKGEVSERQLSALMKIASRYVEQVPELGGIVEARKQEASAAGQPESGPAAQTTLRKLQVASGLNIPESSLKFVASLQKWADGGRELTPSQMRSLNRLIHQHARQIENYDVVKQELGLGEEPQQEEDHVSGDLIAGMRGVQTWKEPVKRGKMTFSDEAFYRSLSQQFERKGGLSIKQQVALKKMVTRYRDQVPNYEELTQKHGFGKKAD